MGGRGAGVVGGGAIEEAVSKMANATKGVNSEREKLDVLGVEGGDDLVVVSGVREVATEFGLCFLIVPVISGIRSVWDMGGGRGGRSDDDVYGKVGGGSDVGGGEVGGEEM